MFLRPRLPSIQSSAVSLLFALAACGAPPDPGPGLGSQSLALGAVELDARLAVTSRWSGGYCANVTLQNPSSRTVSGWSVDLDLDGSRLGSAWSAEATVEEGVLHASARADNAVLAPGQQRSFGFCADEPAGRSEPAVLEASGADLADAPAGTDVELRLTSEWGSGYCAEIRVHNPGPARTWTWAVKVDPNGTLSSAWSSATELDGELVTFRPLAWNSVLEPGATAYLGFCAQAAAGQRPVLVEEQDEPVHALRVAVYLPRRISTCFIGEPCAPGSDSCIGLRNDANELAETFTLESFAAVKTTSPARAGAAKEVCLELVASAAEEAATLAGLEQFRANVAEWSRGTLDLTLDVIPFDHIDIGQSRLNGGGLWIAPEDLAELALPELGAAPDFNLVIAPVRDPVRGLHHDLGGCANTHGSDRGLAGAGFSWIPMTGAAIGFECADETSFTHEWLHQVHWSYHTLSGFADPYGRTLPMCGGSELDPRAWFPDTHQCNEDPDFEGCGRNDCHVTRALVNEHVISEHFDPRVEFVANHCKNGLQDFGETGVDTGGACL